MLHRDVVVLQRLSFDVGAVEHSEGLGGEGDLAATHHRRDRVESTTDRSGDVRGMDIELRQHRVDEPVRLGEEAGEEVDRLYIGMVTLGREFASGEDGLLRFLRESVEVHEYPFVELQDRTLVQPGW